MAVSGDPAPHALSGTIRFRNGAGDSPSSLTMNIAAEGAGLEPARAEAHTVFKTDAGRPKLGLPLQDVPDRCGIENAPDACVAPRAACARLSSAMSAMFRYDSPMRPVMTVFAVPVHLDCRELNM